MRRTNDPQRFLTRLDLNRCADSIFNLLSLLMLFVIVACAGSGTKFTSIEMDRSYDGGLINHIMVVARAEKAENRQTAEEQLVGQFKQNGVRAVASMDSIPDQEALNRSTLKAQALEAGVTHVLVLRILSSVEKIDYSEPGTVSKIRGNNRRITLELPILYDFVSNPNKTYKYLTLASDLYEVQTEKRIWSATSESFDPATVNDVIKPLGRNIIEDLRSNHLLP